MSQRQMQGQPMIILGEDAQRMKDKSAQEHNISAARAVAESVRSTLGPKGMDKMLVSSTGDVTVTNDGVTILTEMDIDNPTASMIVEVAETQEDEAGDGTTTAVAIAGELLKNASELLDQDIHPSSIIRGFNLASTEAKSILDDISTQVDRDDEELLKKVAETSMTGKGAEANKDLLAELIVEAVQAVTVKADDGSYLADLEYLDIHKQIGRSAGQSELLNGAVIDKDPVHEEMPTDVEDAKILLKDTPIELDETDVDAKLAVDNPDQLQTFLDQEEAQLKEVVDKIEATGANVLICQKKIDDMAEHYLAQKGILALERVKQSDVKFLKEVLGARVVSDLDTATEDDLGHGTISRNDDHGIFYIEGTGEDAHGVTLVLHGSTDHVADELERGVTDALDVVTSTVANGEVLGGGGAPEVEVAARLRDYADSVEGREQLAIEAFADALEIVPRTLAENAGLDAIDTLVDLRSAHDDGDVSAGLNVFTGDVENTLDTGVVEPTHAKRQAVSSAAEAANLVLKIDDIIAADELSTSRDDDPDSMEAQGQDPGAGMGGMGGGMGGMM